MYNSIFFEIGQSEVIRSDLSSLSNLFSCQTYSVKKGINGCKSLSIFKIIYEENCLASRMEVLFFELNIGFERPIKLHAGESVQIDRRSKSTPLGLDNTNFTSQHIRKGDVAYYTKQNVGTDCLQVLLVHPGSPAPVESLSTVVTHSHDIVRIGRELNVMPSSECFHLTLKEDEIVLLLPLHFRQRVLDIKSNKLSSKDSMLTLELDLINHVLEGRAK